MAKKMKIDMNDAKMQGFCKMHMKMMGCKMLVLGALVLANNYWKIVDWTAFIGGLLVIAGVVKMIMPMHKCK